MRRSDLPGRRIVLSDWSGVALSGGVGSSTNPGPTGGVSEKVSFSALATAAYCPRQLYYRRRDPPDGVPVSADRAYDLAGRYPDLALASDAALRTFDLAVPPDTYRRRLRALRERDCWSTVTDPPERDVFLDGRDARGRVQKVGYNPLRPVLVSPGDPADDGVWEPQRVRAVAAALALSWRERTEVDSALVEYPRHGVVRTVRLTARNRAAYRRTLRAVRGLDGPPPRLRDDARCRSCDYRTECGVKTRTLRSLL